MLYKSILITGGTSGIGLALTKLAVQKYEKVGILGRDIQKLNNLQKEFGDKLEVIECDLLNHSAIETATEKIKNYDVLVNNAGIIKYGKLEDHTSDVINKIVQTNLTALIQLSKIVLPAMKFKNSGAIVNISSTSGMFGRANETVYVASKWGVRGFTEGLKQELADTHIRVIGVYPGGVETDLFAKAGDQKPSGDGMMKPEQIAEIILYALSQPKEVKMDTIVVNRDKNGW